MEKDYEKLNDDEFIRMTVDYFKKLPDRYKKNEVWVRLFQVWIDSLPINKQVKYTINKSINDIIENLN